MAKVVASARLLSPWKLTGRYVRINRLKRPEMLHGSVNIKEGEIADLLGMQYFPTRLWKEISGAGSGPYRRTNENIKPIIDLDKRIIDVDALKDFLDPRFSDKLSRNIQLLRSAGFILRCGEEFSPDMVFQALVGRLVSDEEECFENKYGEKFGAFKNILNLLQSEKDINWRKFNRNKKKLSDISLDFNGLVFAGFIFERSNLNGVTFLKADLREARFFVTYLNNTSFREADLSEASLERVYLGDTDFSGANLSCAKLEGLRFEVKDAVFEDTNFTRARLRGTIFDMALNDSARLSFEELLSDSNAEVRKTAAEALLKMDNFESDFERNEIEAHILVAEGQLVEAVKLGQAAIPALAKINGKVNWEEKINVFSNLVKTNREHLLRPLMELIMGGMKGVPGLIKIEIEIINYLDFDEREMLLKDLLNHRNPRVKSMAHKLLGKSMRKKTKMKNKAKKNTMKPIQTKSVGAPKIEPKRDKAQKIALALELGQRADNEAINELRSMLSDKDNEVRKAVIRAMGKTGRKEIIPDLKNIIGKDLEAQVEAVLVLREMKRKNK
jgi:uncharacterized protein YjbI with pentapeptide repeats